jgi:hypothetical protein
MASVLVSGGVPPYNYIWNTGSSDNSIDNLTIGTYELYVTDSEGCGINTFIEIADDGISPISFSLNETNSDCGITNNGIASINVWGDSGPYSYNWSNGQNTESINNLAAGTYQATITDINGCTQIAEALIDSNNSDILLDIQSHANCEGTSLQTNTSITNGTPPFTYLWSDGQNTLNAFNLSEGEYNLTVTDANNCMASTNVTVTANAPQAISTIISPADNQNNGYYMCSIAINGATAPYNFNWETTGYVRYEIDAQNGLIQVVYAANADWTVTINDNCYVATTMVNNNDVVYPTNSMALDIVDYTVYPDNGDADGKLIVIVNGGTPQYHYTWQGPQEWLPSINEGYGLNALNNLTTGWYTVTVTDNSSPQQSTMGWYWVSASTNNGSGKDSQMLFSETLQATPNPFAERTTINFTANKTAEAKLIVYDLAGQQIMVSFKSLLQKEQKYNIPLNAASLNKGMYLCTLTYDDGYSETIRLMIAK